MSQGVEGDSRVIVVEVDFLGKMESPLRGVGVDGFPDVPVGHEQLDVLFVGVGGKVGGAAGFLVSPEGDQSQSQLARNR